MRNTKDARSWLRRIQGFGPAARLAALFASLALLAGPAAFAQGRIVSPQTGQAEGGFGATACNGRGELRFDRCFCDPGWTGSQCGSREVPPNCSDHGKAVNDRCRCDPGWKGHSCNVQLPVCVHGKLQHDKCACEAGWSGGLCDKEP